MAKTDLLPETVRRMMLKNTAVMDEYQRQIQDNTDKLADLLEAFKESITHG